jgi:hypothetical protein
MFPRFRAAGEGVIDMAPTMMMKRVTAIAMILIVATK